MISWGELREMIRRTILKDAVADEETGDYRWSDVELRDCVWWALDQFANHTAVATATSFAVTGVSFEMPRNALDVEPLELTSRVRLVKGSTVRYLDPVHYTEPFLGSRDQSDEMGFYVYPETTVMLTKYPGDGYTLEIDYFAYYNNPYADDDLVTIPRWAHLPLVYLTSAHALSGPGLKSAIIRQWGAKPDTGTPEHNPIRQQQKWFLDMYACEIAKRTPQARINHFREYS